MSIISTSSITELPGIQTAISHLQDLRERMKKEEFGFKDHDTDNIDVIIESIQDLENERLHSHDLLETETIKASILRHKLLYFPDEVKREITAAVNSSRDSNAAELKRLQDELNAINEKIDFCETRVDDLDSENSKLHPERDNVRRKHEEVIAQLNHRMAEKASKQIMLNETRDRLRETNQRIVDLEEGIIHLKEDLIQERQDHRTEKKRLKKAIADTSKKTKDQKDINIEKKREMDGLLEELRKSEETLDTVKKSIRKFEASKAKLEGQERALTAQHTKEVKLNQELRKKGMELQREMEQQQREYEERRRELQKKIFGLKEDIKTQKQKGEHLADLKGDLEEEVKEAMVIRQKDHLVVMEHNEELQNAKTELAMKAEDCGRLQQENIDMEIAIEQLAETHKAVVNSLNKVVEDSRELLTKERKERMELQTQREEVSKDVDDFRIENQKYMKGMNKKVTEGKSRHEALTREGTQLQRAIKEDDSNTARLGTELKELTANYENMKRRKENEVSKLEGDINKMENTLKEKKDFLDVRQPQFVELENKFAESTSDFDFTKKNVVALKNKKSGLEDTTKRMKHDIEKQAVPKAMLQADLKKARQASMEGLRNQAQERSTTERELYTVGCKLKTVLEENDRFNTAIKKLEQNIETIMNDIEMNIALKTKLHDDISMHKGILNNEWKKDTDLQKGTNARDQILVDGMTSLLAKTHKREDKVNDITTQLFAEVDLLALFLANVNSKRPKAMRDEFTEYDEFETQIHESPSKEIDAVATANTFVETKEQTEEQTET
ncbi:coiled-coil domain-containing protein 175-like [Lineus longissimus]|uniref:coiled-coil domain-containing protein 175-like n=1 Tax=Lineus longissimus TaxID=88925 RepID=UPI002B4C59CB